MARSFVDYFELGDLDPEASREANYHKLTERHAKASTQKGKEGKRNMPLLSEAMEVFNNEKTYAEYRAVWERRRHREPEPEPVETTSDTEPHRPGLGSLLGSLAAKGLQAYLENRTSAPASLSGVWRDQTGTVVRVEQLGNRLEILATDTFGRIQSQGVGRLTGQEIRYQARNPAGQVGNGVFRVNREGTVIEGTVTWFPPPATYALRLVRD
jgi:hypothetical protein